MVLWKSGDVKNCCRLVYGEIQCLPEFLLTRSRNGTIIYRKAESWCCKYSMENQKPHDMEINFCCISTMVWSESPEGRRVVNMQWSILKIRWCNVKYCMEYNSKNGVWTVKHAAYFVINYWYQDSMIGLSEMYLVVPGWSYTVKSLTTVASKGGLCGRMSFSTNWRILN
jgi:hypothetical protein